MIYTKIQNLNIQVFIGSVEPNITYIYRLEHATLHSRRRENTQALINETLTCNDFDYTEKVRFGSSCCINKK